jgi:membrane protein
LYFCTGPIGFGSNQAGFFMLSLNKLTQYLFTHPLWLQTVRWSKTHSIPGLKRVPLYDLLMFILAEIRRDAIVTRANSMAFSFFLAIFPSIIFLVTLLPYMPYGEDFFDTLRTSISEVMPGDSGLWVFKTVEDLLQNEQRDLLSVGFFLALWFSSNGMMSMMNGLRKDYREVFVKRPGWEKRLIAIKLTFLLTLALFVLMVLVILGNTVLNTIFTVIEASWVTKLLATIFRWVVVVVLFYTGISLVYRYGASTRQPIPFFNSGATLATLLSLIVSWGFSFYADNIGKLNTVYGSIGAIIALLLWIQINCLVLLIGFELNAGIAVLHARWRARKEANEV